MKSLIILASIIISNINYISAQDSSEFKDVYELIFKYDFSSIFVCDKFQSDNGELRTRNEPIGYFGNNYQRIFIHFISVIRNDDSPSKYFVYGKSKLKNNICDFQGQLIISEVLEYINDEYTNLRRGIIKGNYSFHEDMKQKGTGKFEGTFASCWLINENGNIEFDGILFMTDGYINNAFKGKWYSHTSNDVKVCNWGDYRIPESHDLDLGAGEFSPNKKYWDLGWKSYYYRFGDEDDPEVKKAKKIENEKWWIK